MSASAPPTRTLAPQPAPAAPAVAPALIARGLTVRLGATTIIDAVDVELAPGRITALVGPNGSGKSTLLRAFSRILRPAAGSRRARRRGHRDAPHARRRPAPRAAAPAHRDDDRRHGRARSSSSAASRTSAASAACAPPTARRSPGRWRSPTPRSHADRLIDTLSGGERQRAWLAVALAQRTGVLLLDEPTTYLDVRHQLEVMALVRRLNAEHGLTVCWVLHDLNAAAAYSDAMVCLRDGPGARAGPARRAADRRARPRRVRHRRDRDRRPALRPARLPAARPDPRSKEHHERKPHPGAARRPHAVAATLVACLAADRAGRLRRRRRRLRRHASRGDAAARSASSTTPARRSRSTHPPSASSPPTGRAPRSSLALGVAPVAVGDRDTYRNWVGAGEDLPASTAAIGARYEPSLEKIAALKPDLIVQESGELAKGRDKLEAIAPDRRARRLRAQQGLAEDRMGGDARRDAQARDAARQGRGGQGAAEVGRHGRSRRRRKRIKDAGRAGDSVVLTQTSVGGKPATRLFDDGSADGRGACASSASRTASRASTRTTRSPRSASRACARSATPTGC